MKLKINGITWLGKRDSVKIDMPEDGTIIKTEFREITSIPYLPYTQWDFKILERNKLSLKPEASK